MFKGKAIKGVKTISVEGQLRAGIKKALMARDASREKKIAIHESSQRWMALGIAKKLASPTSDIQCHRSFKDLSFQVVTGEDKDRYPVGSIIQE